ncbi:6-carboxytetrahydropterin synthase QueD [Candidatus Parcubacteria bacterium]|nr:MAG: 6-carboxytetrahydropterin synthase QueD [Candidatus Parcubacteria bacterium]
MGLLISKRYKFEAAHYLPFVPEGHPCKRLHGHSYSFTVTLKGEVNELGFVLDYNELDVYVKGLADSLDHRLLNEIKGLENPTAENICVWLADKLNNTEIKSFLHSVKVKETEKTESILYVNRDNRSI